MYRTISFMKREKIIESPTLFDPAAIADMNERVIRAGRQVKQRNTQEQATAAGLQIVREVRPYRPVIRRNDQIRRQEDASTA